MRRLSERGFTLIELVVVLAIIGIMIVITMDRFQAGRPRSSLEAASTEIQSLIHVARLDALASGRSVTVLLFPKHVEGNGQGRIVVIRESTDPAQSLFVNTADLTFEDYAPGVLAAPTGGAVIATFDLPRGIEVGPESGITGSAMPFPYTNAVIDVDCSFCIPDDDRRGAIRFNERGIPDFPVKPAGSIAAPSGQSFTIQSTEVNGRATFIVTTPQGTVRTFRNG